MNKISFFVLLAVISQVSFPVEAHRILAVFAFHGKSHFVMNERLVNGLAERGHQVDVVSHFPPKKPIANIRQIADLSGSLPNLVNNMTLNFAQEQLMTGSAVETIATMFGNNLCSFLGLPELQKVIKNPPKDPPYDLVIVELFGSSCYVALGHHFGVPVVGTVTALMFPWVNEAIANPDNPSYIPYAFSSYGTSMSLWERIDNTFCTQKAKWDFNRLTVEQDDYIKKYIGPHGLGVREAENNISLILVNSHYSLQGVRPFTTAVVEVGGLHIDESKAKLSEELKRWLDDSKDGFVYISYGSMLKIESFPKKDLDALYASLRKLAPVRVLMKIANANELPPGLPSNVLTNPWISQLAVLRHKNIRAFVTHGGLMGTQEAIYYGVPMIGVPFFGDQPQNVNLYVRKGIAVSMDFLELTEEKWDAAFDAILRNPSYLATAKKISALFRDRPMSALDTSIYWVEHVIRHGGTNLKSPALNLTWWQVALLDVYGIALLALAAMFYTVKVIFTKLTNILVGPADVQNLKKHN